MLADVAAVRELAPMPSLKASVVARKDLPALLDRTLTAEDRQYYANTTTLYRLLGHLSRDQDLQSVFNDFGGGAVLGLYSPPDQELWVVNDSGSLDVGGLSREEKSTLAHELVHALQDYHFHLQDSYGRVVTDLDRNLAWAAAVEGDAVTHEQLYTKRYLAIPLAGPRGPVLLAANAAALASTPPSLQREFLFPYTAGADFVMAVRARGGARAVDTLITGTPAGTALVLHPNLYFDGWKPLDVTLPGLEGALGRGWKRESGGTFGEFGLRNYLQLRLPAGDAAAAAAGWAGDHYDVYVNGAQSAAAFRIRFRDGDAAARFVAAREAFLKRAGAASEGGFDTLPEGPVTAALARDGDTVTFVIASARGAADAAQRALR